MLLLRVALTLALGAAAPGPAWALDQDLSELQRAAAAYARSQTADLPGQVDVTAAALDPRTRLGRCESVQPFLVPGAKLWGSASVGLRCLRPERWTVYVAVTVKVTGDVVVTAVPVRRGEVLEPGDVRLERVDLTQLPADVVTDPQQAVGKSVQVALPAGLTLRGDMLRSPPAVTAGQRVRIQFQGEGFTVSSEGKALGTAGIGEPVQVRTASGRVLSGFAQEPGVVLEPPGLYPTPDRHSIRACGRRPGG
jgi:flagella basal body P-ring formation protein FlgA